MYRKNRRIHRHHRSYPHNAGHRAHIVHPGTYHGHYRSRRRRCSRRNRILYWCSRGYRRFLSIFRRRRHNRCHRNRKARRNRHHRIFSHHIWEHRYHRHIVLLRTNSFRCKSHRRLRIHRGRMRGRRTAVHTYDRHHQRKRIRAD